MPTVALTDTYIRAVDLPVSGRIDLYDARCMGLVLRVSATGVKAWSYRYRDKLTEKIERFSIGRFPSVSLAAAREIADQKRGSVAKGGNPRADFRKAKAAERAAISLSELIDTFLRDYAEKRRPKSAPATRTALNPVKMEWGSRKAKDIVRTDIIGLLKDRAAATPIAANRTHSALSKMFGWAIDEGILDVSPMFRVRKPSEENTRDRVLQDDELKLLWAELDQADAGMARVLRFLALTGQRLGEVIGMTVDELRDLDRPSDARWEIPADRVKNGRLHVVPLPAEARTIVREALKAKAKQDDSAFVFVSTKNPGNPFDRQSFARLMKRIIMGLKGDDETKDIIRRLQADQPTPHDFRRTFVTGLGRLGIPREHVKAVVNHAEGDVTERNYDRYDRLPEKRRALIAWEAHMLAIVSGEPAGDNVVAFG